MRCVEKLNAGWHFYQDFSPALITTFGEGVAVRTPHNAIDLEMNYFDERCYQKAFCYQRRIRWSEDFRNREVSLVFDGAMADSVVWLNGEEVARHRDGYTPFEARLTGLLKDGDNLVTVRIDGAENPDIPPFGGQIDYLTYAGIYRDVWLKVTDSISIARIKVETLEVLSDARQVLVRIWLNNPQRADWEGIAEVDVRTLDGVVVKRGSVSVNGPEISVHLTGLEGVALWELDRPVLYEIAVSIRTSMGKDELKTRFGFRTAKFTSEGFFLNGRLLKLRGLNRHQSFPYVGYAMGRRAQERDADILKHRLHCNVVRTSHYPQSPYFLDRCDEIGLLVFEEIPGWQHIGGVQWKNEALDNVRRMIKRDWNHPSIILWGVRINESRDDHDFYTHTNEVARALDATRQTGGVRYLENSELLEDVYTINDFFNGAGPEWLAGGAPMPLRDPQVVTGLPHAVPYLVTEFNGHMYPTKRIDPEHRQSEHVIRHLQVLNAAYGNPGISGAIGWCMADYNTHKDFGSGDRICHHGVLDIFRQPKFAAYAYASQCEPSDEIVLEPVTYWARGERDRCEILPLMVLTNCDYLDFHVGDVSVLRVMPDRDSYPHLPHPPVVIDSRHIDINDLGAWGMVWRDGRIVGYVNGEAVREMRLCGNPVPTTLDVQIDDEVLLAEEKDATRVIVRVLDQAGRTLPFLDDTLRVDISGPAKLLGPDLLIFKGGLTGFWLETTGASGHVTVRLRTRRLAEKLVTLQVK